MALGFRTFISKVFVNGKFPKILPSENLPLYGNSPDSCLRDALIGLSTSSPTASYINL